MEFRLEEISNAARELQAQATDPLCAYIYDLSALRPHVQGIVDSLPSNCEMFYAIKANAELPILEALQGRVHGFEVASGGELALMREQFPDEPVIFGGPGKLDSELAAAMDQGVELVHVESLGELQRLARLTQARNQSQAILLRMNVALDSLPQTTLTMGGKATPFGIDTAELADCLGFIADQPLLQLKGFHFHLVSHQMDARAHLALLADYCRLVKTWRQQYGLDIGHINVGGGIGINYREPDTQFDWTVFAEGLHALVEREGMQEYTLRFECGRYLTAPCGYYAMEVMDLKRNHGQLFAVCRGGTHHFRTPPAQGHDHPFMRLPTAEPGQSISGERITVVGQLCTPKDVLAREIPVDEIAVGDLLLFTLAGAYAWNISHQQFLRHPAPVMRFLQQ